MSKSEFKNLISLLSENSDDIAREIISSLVENHLEELRAILPTLQDNENIIVRKRAQQIQAFLVLHERRDYLFDSLATGEFSMATALIYLHLLWFDKDSHLEIREIYNKLANEFQYNSDILKSLQEFFLQHQFVTVKDNYGEGECCLLGTVFDSRHGNQLFFTALAISLIENIKNSNIQAVTIDTQFYLIDLNNSEKLSFEDFSITNSNEIKIEQNLITPKVILKQLIAILYANSISNDEFRYVEVFGELLSNYPKRSLKFLPYPYGRNTKIYGMPSAT